MLEKNRMTSKIIFIALVVFFITTVSHAQGIFGNNSSSSSSNVSSQQSTSETTIPQGNTTNNTTTTTTNNTSISSNIVTSDTNIDSIPQDDGTRALGRSEDRGIRGSVRGSKQAINTTL